MAARKGTSNLEAVNVQVILRCRPVNKDEIANRTPQVIQVNEKQSEVVFYQNVAGKMIGRSFHFDKCFGPESGQARLYDQAVSPIVEEVLDGFNCTIFAYGQTGTGKTYTMEGGDRNSEDGHDLSEVAGVIPRAINQIFHHLDSINSEYTVKCSFLELYNEETTDLLAIGDALSRTGDKNKLRMLEDKSGVVVQNLEEIIVKTSADIYGLLDRGSAKRRTAETLLNKQSSRSHSVFCVTVHMRETDTSGEEVIKTGKLHLVDLAGSENISRSGAVDMRAKEAGVINKSLLTLGRVITALVEGSGHIPYRDSKLTRLLRDSLGGRTKTCIIANIAPTVQCQEETLSTLDYAHRAKNIRNRPEVNQRVSKTAHIKELNAEIDKLKGELFATREKNGVYVPSDAYAAREEEEKANRMRIEMLEAELEGAKDGHRQELEQATADLRQTQEELAETYSALQRARQGLEERDFLIATHERSEDALAEHAAGLARSLQTSVQDLQSTFSLCEEGIGREQGNAVMLQALKESTMASLSGMQASLSEAAEQQTQRFQGLMTLVSGFLQQKDASFTSLQACPPSTLIGMGDQLSCISQTAAEAAMAAEFAAAQQLDGIQALTASHAAAAAQAGREAHEALAGAWSRLEGALHSQRTQLEAFTAEQAAGMQAWQEQLAQGLTGAMTSLQGASSAVQDTQAHAASAAAEQDAALHSLERDFQAQMQSDQAALQEQIAALLSGFAERKAGEVATAVAAVRQQLGSDHEACASDLHSLAATISSTSNGIQEVEAASSTRSIEVQSSLQGHRSTLQAAISQAAQQGGELEQLSSNAQTAAMDAASRQTDEGQSAVATAKLAFAETIQQGQQQCTSAVEAAASICQEASAGLQTSHAQDQALGAEASASAGAGCSHMSSFASASLTSLQGLQSELAPGLSSRLQPPPSGPLPTPHQVEMPPGDWLQQLRVPPCDQVLAQYHRLKSGTASPAPAAAAPAHSHFPSENDPPLETIAAVRSHPLEEHTSKFTLSLPRGSMTAGHKGSSLHLHEGRPLEERDSNRQQPDGFHPPPSPSAHALQTAQPSVTAVEREDQVPVNGP
ncbi:hypothetical protein WJX74_010806 [Apatococcus lobatus]|uniref:Kinesin motor domain-containing protein n=1 Tax=Apatococcus lobatus TaxID=904363 RepID=A0AAW1R0W5_9CHLO